MVIRQSRFKIMPLLALGLFTLALGLTAAAALLGHGARPIPPTAWIAVGVANLVSLTMAAVGGYLMLFPGTLEIDPRGLSLSYFGRTRFWPWAEVSDFHLSGAAAAIRFEVAAPDLPAGRLPGSWPGGLDRLAARLEAAQRQFTDLAWSGADWMDATPQRGSPIIGFAVSFAAVLSAVAVFYVLVSGRPHP